TAQPQVPDIPLQLHHGGPGPALAFDGRDNLIAAWAELRTPRVPRTDIYLQRFDRHGQAQAPAFVVHGNSGPYDYAQFPKVATARDGTFVVVWSQYLYDNGDSRMLGQRFDGNGTRLGAEFNVRDTTGDEQPSGLAMNDAHEFLVVWGDNGVG